MIFMTYIVYIGNLTKLVLFFNYIHFENLIESNKHFCI
jgi:hypothetical protein